MKSALGFLLLWAGFSALYYLSFAANVELITFQNGVLKISDFAYYSVIVRAFWFQGHRGFYNLDGNIEVLRQLTDPQFEGVMPLAVTPVAPVVLLPFSWISLSSVPLAQSVWVGLSLSAIAWGIFCHRALWASFPPIRKIQGFALLLLLISSNVFFVTLALGQTSLLLLCLLYTSDAADE